MKKMLSAFMLAWVCAFSSYAQTGSSTVITNNVTISGEEQLATLFSKLNFADVKTGLLEERGFCPLRPDYFAGEGKAYQKLSAQALNSWKQQYQTTYTQSYNASYGVTGMQPALKRLDSAVQKYFIPALSAANTAPASMKVMQQQTDAYRKLDSTIALLSKKSPTLFNTIKIHLAVVSTLLKPYMDSYSPQALHTMLTDDNAASILALRMLYDGMYNASLDTLRRPLASLAAYDAKIQAAPAGIVSISMMHLNYYTLLPTAITENLLTYSGGSFRDVSGRNKSPYLRTNIVAAATLSDTLASVFEYIIKPELFISNTGKALQWVDIDFGNGQGYRRVTMNTPASISYTQGGDVQIKYMLRYTDGTVAVCQSGAYVKQRVLARMAYDPSSADKVSKETTTRKYQDKTAAATVSISYACGNDRLRKPLIVVEGFDPTNVLNYKSFMLELSSSDNPNNIYYQLQYAGYDIVYVEFEDPSTFIQRNAYLLEDIITRINARKEGTDPITVVGISMGGLVARYALREMEVLGKPHHADRFITFDTPHLGANVPLGFQYCFNDIGNDRHFVLFNKVQLGFKILGSDAAKQMLVATPDGAYQHKAFLTELNGLGNGGFPAQTRNIAISNGSLSGNGQIFAPGAELLSINGNSVNTVKKPLWKRFGFFLNIVLQTRYAVDIKVYAMPNHLSGQSVVYRGKMFAMILGVPVLFKDATGYSKDSDHPYDSAPGGKYNLDFIMGDVSKTADFVNISIIKEFCFVSTVSALNLASPYRDNLYYNVNANNVIPGKTNFERIGGPIGLSQPGNQYNQEHTAFAPSNNVLFHDQLIDNVKHSLIGNNYLFESYNFGAGTINRLGNLDVNNNTTLFINANQHTDYITSTNPKPLSGSNFTVSVDGADNCYSNAKVRIQGDASLVLGDAVTGNTGVLEVRNEAAVEIQNEGVLTINSNSELHIKAGATLVIRVGAIVNLNGKITVDPGAYLCIESWTSINYGPYGRINIATGANEGANPITGIVTTNCNSYHIFRNEALRFDGIDDFVNVPETDGSLNLGTGDFTFEAFIKSDYLGSTVKPQMIITKREHTTLAGFMWGIHTNGTMFAQLNNSPNWGFGQGPNVLDGNCHFVALVRQGTLLTFYVDNEITYQTTISNRNISSAASLVIGDDHISDVPFKGLIGEVRVWNSDEIPYESNAVPTKPNLVAYWEMDDVSDQTLNDISLKDNTGTLGSTPGLDNNDPLRLPLISSICPFTIGNFRTSKSASDTPYYDQDSSSAGTVKAYPNPFSDEISIDVTGLGEHVDIKIRNENGTIVFSKDHCVSAEKLYVGDALPDGFYIMEVTSGSYSKNVKIIKVSQ